MNTARASLVFATFAMALISTGCGGGRKGDKCRAGTFGQDCRGVCDCQNGGACDDGQDGSGSCVCPIGVYGANCESACDCQNGGLCDDGAAGSGMCVCDEEFFGADCSGTCDCENGSTCGGISGECSCLSGFFGADCAGICTCENGGTCDDGPLGSGACTCSPGFFGADCGGVCDCSNGGTCDDGAMGTGTCSCVTGFSGADCSQFVLALQVTDMGTALELPRGPDALGGMGSGNGEDLGDFVLGNSYFSAVIGQPGTDPTSTGGAFPLAYGQAPGGGSLVDLTAVNSEDHWNEMGQGVLGRITRAVGATGSADASTPAFVDAGATFVTNGVEPGDTLTITSGLNSGRSYRVGLVISETTLELSVAPGAPYEAELSGSVEYTLTHRTNPLENTVQYDSATIIDGSPSQVTLRLQGVLMHNGALEDQAPEPMDGTTVSPISGVVLADGMPVTVETDYVVLSDHPALRVSTRITNPSSNPIGLLALADTVVLGGVHGQDLATFTPTGGFQPNGILGTPTATPYVGFQSRSAPDVSYAIADVQTGHVLHNGEPALRDVVTQLTLLTDLSAGSTASWEREVLVNRPNGSGSALDAAIDLLAVSTDRTAPDGTTRPNGFEGSSTIAGHVTGAPPGTRITAIQTAPALVYDLGSPRGLTAAPGFYPFSQAGPRDLPMNTTRPDEDGAFSLRVPLRFAGLSATATADPDIAVPTGLEMGLNATYAVLVEAPGMPVQTLAVNLPQDPDQELAFDFTHQAGTLVLSASDSSGGPLPVTFVVVGMDPDGLGPIVGTPNPTLGTPEPSITSGLNGEFASGAQNVVHTLSGSAEVIVPPGFYQVIATRGLEYTAARYPESGAAQPYFQISSGEVVATEPAGSPLQLHRILDFETTPFDSPLRRYIAADFHVHSGGSFDATVSPRDRLISLLASGVEFAVITDHDQVTDLSTSVADLNAESSVNLLTMFAHQSGVETTGSVPLNIPAAGLEFSNTIGTFSAWPLTAAINLRRNGSPPDEYRSPAELLDQLRALSPTVAVVQLQQPRGIILPSPLPRIGSSFFTNGKLNFDQPTRGLSSLGSGGYEIPLTGGAALADLVMARSPAASTYIDVDTIEIYDGAIDTYDATRLDWYALLSAGIIRTATANSKSHGVTDGIGFPRTYVFATGNASADVSAVDPSNIYANLLASLVQATPAVNGVSTARPAGGSNAMEVLGSSGPVVFLEVDADEDGIFEVQPGDFIADDGDGAVDVRVTVLAAPWVPVDTVTLIINGGNAAGALSGLNAAASPVFTLAPNPADPFSTDVNDAVRVRETVTVVLPVGNDDWIAAEARGVAALGSTYDRIVPERNVGFAPHTIVGFCNPIFIDSNMDGDWDPNGVP